MLVTHSGRPALVYLPSVLVQRLLLPLQRGLKPAGCLRPSGEFCAAKEGYFTKYNAL